LSILVGGTRFELVTPAV